MGIKLSVKKEKPTRMEVGNCLKGIVNDFLVYTDPNDIIKAGLYTSRPFQSKQCLLWAGLYGYTDIICKIRGKGKIEDELLKHFFNVLTYGGHLDLIKTFIRMYFESEVFPPEYARSMLKYAYEKGHVDIIIYLKDFVDEQSLYRPVSFACLNDHREIITYVLDNFSNLDYWTLRECMCNAALNGRLSLLKFLIERYKDYGRECLNDVFNYASQGGHEETIRYLLAFNPGFLENDLGTVKRGIVIDRETIYFFEPFGWKARQAVGLN